jgi:PHP family Zn ribbon phosphoesterase
MIERFHLLECECQHSFVRSEQKGSNWRCPKCGEIEEVDNIVADIPGPERSLTSKEADKYQFPERYVK